MFETEVRLVLDIGLLEHQSFGPLSHFVLLDHHALGIDVDVAGTIGEAGLLIDVESGGDLFVPLVSAAFELLDVELQVLLMARLHVYINYIGHRPERSRYCVRGDSLLLRSTK